MNSKLETKDIKQRSDKQTSSNNVSSNSTSSVAFSIIATSERFNVASRKNNCLPVSLPANSASRALNKHLTRSGKIVSKTMFEYSCENRSNVYLAISVQSYSTLSLIHFLELKAALVSKSCKSQKYPQSDFSVQMSVSDFTAIHDACAQNIQYF